MKIIKPSYEILTPISETGIPELQHIERIARVCYKSEDKISPDGKSAEKMVKMLIDREHEAMLEHGGISVLFICDRGVSHEIVRHRLASFAQESTRYCNYSKEKFGTEITFIEPIFFEEDKLGENGLLNYKAWAHQCFLAEQQYLRFIGNGCSPQEARSVLPNSLKTELVMTANYREWRHFFKLRCSKAAHPQMRELSIPLLIEFQDLIPVMFDDIYEEVMKVEGMDACVDAYAEMMRRKAQRRLIGE